MSKTNVEVRTGKAAPVELRKNEDGGKVLVGYALTYGNYSRNLGGFVEQIARGAVDKSLADGVRVMARYNHEVLIGTTDAGTLRLSSDDTGLMYEIDLPDTSAGRDVAVLAERGDIHFSSFAFQVPPGGDSWGFTGEDFPLRTLNAIHLVDVAPVDDPAYLDTTSGLRSLSLSTGLPVSTPDEIRAAVIGEPPVDVEQVENHSADSALAIARRRLEWVEAQQ